MKRNLLFTLLFAGFVGIFFIACENPNGGESGGGGVFVAPSSWSDSLNPDTTLLFSATQVTLGGGTSEITDKKNWYWKEMDGQSYPYNLVEDAEDIRVLLDKVEDNWGTNYTTWPDAVIVVWTDPTKNIGFQLHYYAAESGKSYERLICWGIDPSHEFKRLQ
ncbi:MAG: hypothetical protein LBP80_10200 [Treponema sp.]|jgi:hypothetical protein|nr:hypothetical protein [Treponema sp.]